MKDLWNDNLIQFTRLIAEIDQNGGFTAKLLEDLADSMDLEVENVKHLINRAVEGFDMIKQGVVTSEEFRDYIINTLPFNE
jgi:hypothetical protein